MVSISQQFFFSVQTHFLISRLVVIMMLLVAQGYGMFADKTMLISYIVVF